MKSFESSLECEDTRVDTDHQSALEPTEPALHITQRRQAEISSRLYTCFKCGHQFYHNIDGCPKCGGCAETIGCA